jgi:hypothetical protein
MSDLAASGRNSNGQNGDVSARALALLRKRTPDEAAKTLADIQSEKRPIKPSEQLLSTATGVSVARSGFLFGGKQ